ncbi:DUF4012 domain-containing protein [Microbacterium paludicola]|uniref:DUF4012 domain-containing protein n=1 Tax=Microbacterium paludicola TaxID=300019 RepID=UPI0038794A93
MPAPHASSEPAPSRRARREAMAREEASGAERTQVIDVPGHEPQAPRAADERGADDAARRRRRIRKGIIIGLIVLLVAGAWLAARALIVKSEVEAAQRVIEHVQDGGTLEVSVPILGEHAANAASVAVDPVWRLAEFIPWAGDNLRGVRLAAESLDVLTNKLAVPVLDARSGESEEPILQKLVPVIEDNGDKLKSLAADVAGIQQSGALIGPVRAGVEQVNQVMSIAGPLAEFGPELLGANGPRNYLLVFQNNAESVGLGGSAASQTLVRAEGGAIDITTQASSADYQEFVPVDVDVDQSAIDLYSDYLVHHINTSSSRPDFPTMAKITTAFWQRDIAPDQIDGVISIDPIALGKILVATGPIQLSTGDTMTSDNAVQLLLSDVYSRWNSYESPEIVDQFFASVAEQVFGKLSSGDFAPQAMASAVRDGINGGNILFWSANGDVQEQIADERVAGVLPTDNEEETAVGVYFRDESASKIDYYMKSNIDVTQTCEADTSRFDVQTTLHLDIDQAAAEALPDYVKSGNPNWSPTTFRTQVYVYGPPGTTIESVAVEGEEVALKRDDVVDLGRPVAWFETYLNPSELAKVTATFVGDGEFGPLSLRSTPMVQPSTGAVVGCE